MDTTKLQDNIIRKIRLTDDEELLGYLNQLLSNDEESEIYRLTDFEKNIITESQVDYLKGKTISNEDVVLKNKEWLRK